MTPLTLHHSNPSGLGAIVDLNWVSDGSQLITASTDKTGSVWDGESGERIRKFKGHRYFL